MNENITKICSVCGIEKQLNEFYKLTRKRKDGSTYITRHAECIDCNKKKTKIKNDKNKKETMWEKQKKERLGIINKNNFGSLMQITLYNKSTDITVKFLEHGNLARVTWESFCNGEVNNPYDRHLYGIGYVGEGKYKTTINNKPTKHYRAWFSMLCRCYSKTYQEKHPTYKDCEVCDEWLNFQNFATWYDDNYYEIDGQRMEIDKDILIKGNKVYSPDTCIFVPRNINVLFAIKKSVKRNSPIGVFPSYNKYSSHCNDGNGKRVHLGHFNSVEEAFYVYKEFKEKVIKKIADKYKDTIPERLYDAMYKYKIEITD